ncbi:MULTISPECIES: hypothetical protein [Paenibacillus]|nr:MULTISPECIES: hypothetical protein [Paenibacillus]
MDDEAAREQLSIKLAEAEQALKEAEEEYAVYVKQLDHYKRAIQEQKDVILAIKSRMGLQLQ